MEQLLKPLWLKKKIDLASLSEMDKLNSDLKLHTVCKEAQCPNRGECHANGIATFMILGRICTRACKFCDVATGKPEPVDPQEPMHVAQAIKQLGLQHVVITSVARDELPDQGATQFVNTIVQVKLLNPNTTIEVLIPDFRADPALIFTVASAKPQIMNHNIETVARLQKSVRGQATYERSMRVLHLIKQISPNIFTKSGIMVGLGESFDEVVQTMKDLRLQDCEMLTIGQYLRPSLEHLPVKEYIRPEIYEEYERVAKSLGFLFVAAGPYVRSSYMAEQLFNKDKKVLQRAM